MPSFGSPGSSSKCKRRPIRTCDACRLRKVRCDASTMPENQCTNCIASADLLCTFGQQHLQRARKNRLVEELREKISVLEAKLNSISLPICALCSQLLPTSNSDKSEQGDITPDPHEDVSDELTDRFRQWRISTLAKFTPRLFGSASNISLVQSAFAVKEKYLEHPLRTNLHLKRPIYWGQFSASAFLYNWEKDYYGSQEPYIYPDDLLVNHLVERYFANIHPTFPVLHRPSFLQNLGKGSLHRTDSGFGAVVLAVLALASRYSDESSVMIDSNTLSSGWKFVAQLRILPNLSEPTAFHAQFYCLMTLFSLGNSTSHMSWVYLGLAIRLIQYHGPYLRLRARAPKYQDELWNRVFWSVFILDGFTSSLLGHPPVMHLDDFDVDPPLEVDDEYWDHGFVQPPGKPSMLSFFAHFIELFKILGKALGRLYSSKFSKSRRGLTVERETEMVAELDSAMNSFLETLPSHLLWDPSKVQQDVFFDQSAVLHATYHWLQITIHRPYINNPTPIAGPSLSICLTAARSTLSVVDLWSTRSAYVASGFLQNPTFVSAVILLMNIFAAKCRARVGLNLDKDLAQCRKASKVFKACEARWQAAGRQWELLQELQSSQDSEDAGDSKFLPGMSIEQLLSETDGWDSDLIWFPADLMPRNDDQWQAYIADSTN
ncbi:fungal-specific transcription factor domain-containing protein [Roridomyces roridus]|uniref:Fungal-specific transcription factor domain-containing protein n=1 Tax=Roridomyces roridus TaxID=1738132 RepID=A0AAD7CGU3_9AGAR|nr:fungal-specific transcription factor domain-containing protein [Roridomyces roridus]